MKCMKSHGKKYLYVPIGLLWAFMAASLNAIPKDDQLIIPKEDAFDELKIENMRDIKLYYPYPLSWQTVNLTGTWNYKKLNTGESGKPVELSGEECQKITKELLENEHNCATNSYKWDERAFRKRLEKGNYVFATRFELDQNFNKNKNSCVLHFYGVSTDCIIYLNGKKVGEHIGGRTPFLVDVTREIQPGVPNVVMVSDFNEASTFYDLFGDTWGIFEEARVVVAPKAYLERVFINCDTAGNTLNLNLLLRNNGQPLENYKILVKITPCTGKEKNLSGKSELTQKIMPGSNDLKMAVKMEKPTYWEPDNPYLYELTICDSEGNELGKERFGFRDFKIKDGHFHLNGRRIFLFGCQYNSFRIGYPEVRSFIDETERINPGNIQSLIEKKAHMTLLKGIKEMGMNCVRTHSATGYVSRGMLEAFDEVGIIRYDDWHTGFDTGVWKSLTDSEMERIKLTQKEWLFHVYNHAAEMMISFGNELFDADPHRLTELYDCIKPLDRQERPICSSSGRIRCQLWKGEVDKTDFADDHLGGFGLVQGAWLEEEAWVQTLREDINKVYGKDMPLVGFEGVAFPCFDFGPLNQAEKLNKLGASEKVDKKAYVEILTLPAVQEGSASWPRNVVSVGGVSVNYVDEVGAHKANADMFKKLVELLRQQGILQGIGPHQTNKSILYSYDNQYALGYLKKRRPGVKVNPVIDIEKKMFVKTPCFYTLKRCYNPQFISAKWFDRNLIAGLGSISTKIYVINDTLDEHAYTARILFRDLTGKTIQGRTLEFGKVESFGRKLMDYSCLVPADLETGYYRLEMYLFNGKDRIGDNYYEVYVVNGKNIKPDLKTQKKVALYDTAGETYKGLELATTRTAILDKMELNYTPINSFDALDNYQVLIIGANSIDTNVINSGDAIRKWVEKGGRLLSFEQSRVGYIPWLSEMKIIQGGQVSFVNLVDLKHPIFHGLSQRNFDTWSQDYGNGSLFTKALSPMNEAMVAVGRVGYAVYADAVKPVVSDVKLDKGIAVMSQFDFTKRYLKDSVATVLCNNLMRYILSDETNFSYAVSGKKTILLDPKLSSFVNLMPYFNSSFLDEVANDGKGGWDDSGSKNDLREMVTGAQVLSGVPFNIIDPRTNNDRSCIILKHKATPWLPGKVEGIKINDRFKYLYFLHTATWCVGKPGTLHYKFVIHYADNTQEELVIKQDVHIVDWYIASDSLPESTLAWSGKCEIHSPVAVYYTEWKNPKPDVEIASIDFVGEENCVAVLLAVTGYKLVEKEIAHH